MLDIKPIKPYGDHVEAYAVPSASLAKFAYVVNVNQTGEWACSCPAWIWAKPRVNCKHIKKVLLWRRNKTNLPVLEKEKPKNRFSAVEV